MSVALLVVTHNRIGAELIRTARDILGGYPMPCATLEVSRDADLESLLTDGHRLTWELDAGDGVLILTDAFGSTPSNTAVRLGEDVGTAVVSGANLPMLLRVFNYADENLTELQQRAVGGGRDGVVLVDPPPAYRQSHTR